MIEALDRRLAALAATVLVASLLAMPCAADTRLVYERTKERTEVGADKGEVEKHQREVWLGEKAVLISDSEAESRLFTAGSEHLILLRHADRTWEELPEGVTIRDIAPEAFHPYLEKAIRAATAEIEVEPIEGTKRIGEWSCVRHIVRKKARGHETRGEVWTTDEVDLDDALYRRAERLWFGLDPSKALDIALTAMEGLRVETRFSAEHHAGGAVVAIERLVRVEEHPEDASRFEIPEGYRRIPLDTSRWMKMARPGGR